MSQGSLYFKDNFFSAGTTEIYNSSKVKVGELDLKSAFSSGIDVLDQEGNLIVSGNFAFFSNRWKITDKNEKELGILKQKFTFLSKKYEYDANVRGILVVESEPFSHIYEIYDEQSNPIARFEKVSGFFASPAYELSNTSEHISSEELIAVVMGINAIQKRRRNNASGGAAT